MGSGWLKNGRDGHALCRGGYLTRMGGADRHGGVVGWAEAYLDEVLALGLGDERLERRGGEGVDETAVLCGVNEGA